jgi:DNA-binding transcriptional ArsR family regulator
MKVNDDCCDMFKALSAKTRVRILEALKHKGPLGAKRIAVIVGVSPAAVSQHLKVLKQAGLVRSERRGYRIPYHVDVDAMQDCQAKLVQVCECGPHDACSPPRMVVMRRNKPTLKDLEQYRERLERELKAVNERIGKLARKKGG